MTQAKIGLLDIETAPLIANVWGLFDQNVGLNQIDTEWAILSYCFKPLGGGKKSIVYRDNRDSENPRDDHEILTELWHILNDYDFIIAQNGKRFDSRKIQARLILAGFVPPKPYVVIDTMLMARQVAAFTSNKLEWLSDKLSPTKKESHEDFPGFELWRECLKGNPKAWAAMKRYNIQDVVSMEHVYLALRPWYKGHPNVHIHAETDTPGCPKCGSENVTQEGFTFTTAGKYERFVCGDCGGWSRGRYTRNTKETRYAQLSN